MQGELILLSGPSGSGKGTLVAYVRAAFPQFVFPTSWTTRAPREGEREGVSTSGKTYNFVTTEAFEEGIKQNEFLEWARYSDNYYGTPFAEVVDALNSGRTVFQELEIQGVGQILEKLPRGQIKMIFISVGSWEDLRQRILNRQSITEEELEKRRQRFEQELLFQDKSDFILTNEYGKLDETKKNLNEILQSILKE